MPDVEHLLQRCTFPVAGTKVTCAVSGGADSLALLMLACAAGCEVTAIHVDHALRQSSARDAEVVAVAAARFGAVFEARTVDVGAGPNLEARARTARYAVLPENVLTGHTADDQAETVLLNLIRGAGLDGLAGMRAERHPILRLRRHETHELCRSLELTPVVDESNDDETLLRNRVRRDLLPMLDVIASRDVGAVIARQTEALRQDADLLNELAGALDPTDAKALAAAPPSLAKRALRQWVRVHADEQHPPDAASMDRLLAVARGETRACQLPGGLTVSRTENRLRLRSDADFA